MWSGMGAKHSPHVANWALFWLVERQLISVLRQYGVIKHIRFFDDIFAVVATHDKTLEFVLSLSVAVQADINLGAGI